MHRPGKGAGPQPLGDGQRDLGQGFAGSRPGQRGPDDAAPAVQDEPAEPAGVMFGHRSIDVAMLDLSDGQPFLPGPLHPDADSADLGLGERHPRDPVRVDRPAQPQHRAARRCARVHAG